METGRRKILCTVIIVFEGLENNVRTVSSKRDPGEELYSDGREAYLEDQNEMFFWKANIPE